MKEKKKQLTKAETQVMNILWSLPEQQGFIQDIIDRYPEPKPAYTTILTFMKILTDKGFVKPEKVGKANRFSPLVSKDDYTYSFISDVKDTFFDGSFTSLVSFFAKKEQYTDEELAELKDLMTKIESKR
ncbi:Predicted transcriptional regulator [Xylanibacter ruminicola]|uniref:Predicted transcriptional regulator n=1 Tax=Xylanibacter ruminicola TaxID=839 RepID=A0A1M7KN42_XYLRU|nr:BlaI/MecI/CopY family transcriptional regulator [Xylanibacter ruminicola]SFB72377.1 Predicted transcriptional regulator [Xylanibacter ruminicola]SHM66824.1 Predicted transcriptional regulator [Xylanibacter ruminicola]